MIVRDHRIAKGKQSFKNYKNQNSKENSYRAWQLF